MYLKDLLAASGVREVPKGQECRNGKITLTAEADEEGKRLCNGDIFFIREVSPCCTNLHKENLVGNDSVLAESPEQNNSHFLSLVRNTYLVLLKSHVKDMKEARYDRGFKNLNSGLFCTMYFSWSDCIQCIYVL